MSRALFAALAVCALSAPAYTWDVYVSTDRMSGTTSKFIVSYSRNTLEGRFRDGKVMLGYECRDRLIYMRANNLGFHVDRYNWRSPCERPQHSRIKFDSNPVEYFKFCVWEDDHDGMSLARSHRHLRVSGQQNDRLDDLRIDELDVLLNRLLTRRQDDEPDDILNNLKESDLDYLIDRLVDRMDVDLGDDELEGLVELNSMLSDLLDDLQSDSKFMIEAMKSSTIMLVEVELYGSEGREQIAEFDLDGFASALNECER